MVEESCPVPGSEQGRIETVTLQSGNGIKDYQEAMDLAKAEAGKRFEEFMLISWYDRDRDVESPPNTTECGEGCEKNGYILYAMNHGAKLKVDIDQGRFVFFFTPVEW